MDVGRFHPGRRRPVIWLAITIGAGIALALWQLDSGQPAPASPTAVTVERSDVIVSVGGVGRVVVSGGLSAQIAIASSAGTNPASAVAAAGANPVPADAVFARSSGRISKYLVAPGEHVVARQPLAVLDDNGIARAAVAQAKNELAAASLELQQKKTSDPLKGFRPTQAELVAGRLAVTSARQRLAHLVGPARAADVSAAQYDLKRAEADLEVLVGGVPAARAEAIRLAEQTVRVAQDRLDKLLAPPDQADVSAAEADVKKAEADLARLQRPADAPLPEAVTAAQQAVRVAELNFARAKAGGDPYEISAAQLEVDKARADLAALLRPAPAPLPEEVAAAQQAVDAARAKLAKLLGPPNPADVRASRLDLERAQADLRSLRAGPSPTALAAARQAVVYARAKLAQVVGRPAQTDVTAARLDVRRAEADLAVLLARGGPASSIDVGFTQLKIEAAESKLAIARLDQRLLTIRARSAGTVTALLSASGAPVDAATPIAEVSDLARLVASVDLSEFDVARVKKGLKALVSVDALGGKTFTGKVVFASPSGTDNGGVVSFPVRVSLANARGVKPGMNVSVRIVVAERLDVLQVPLEAVSHDDEDRAVVTVVGKSGRTALRPVTLGLTGTKNVEVLRGLRAGERVVIATQSEEA